MIKIHDEDIGDKCLLCGKKYKHRVMYTGNKWLKECGVTPPHATTKRSHCVPLETGVGFKEAEIVTHCANCRVLLKKIKNTSELLKRLETDVEFFAFMREKLVLNPI